MSSGIWSPDSGAWDILMDTSLRETYEMERRATKQYDNVVNFEEF